VRSGPRLPRAQEAPTVVTADAAGGTWSVTKCFPPSSPATSSREALRPALSGERLATLLEAAVAVEVFAGEPALFAAVNPRQVLDQLGGRRGSSPLRPTSLVAAPSPATAPKSTALRAALRVCFANPFGVHPCFRSAAPKKRHPIGLLPFILRPRGRFPAPARPSPAAPRPVKHHMRYLSHEDRS
jgi:hypothetical protein